jgi:hypothetical protein
VEAVVSISPELDLNRANSEAVPVSGTRDVVVAMLLANGRGRFDQRLPCFERAGLS